MYLSTFFLTTQLIKTYLIFLLGKWVLLYICTPLGDMSIFWWREKQLYYKIVQNPSPRLAYNRCRYFYELLQNFLIPVNQDLLKASIDQVCNNGRIITSHCLNTLAVHLVMDLRPSKVQASISLFVDQQIWEINLKVGGKVKNKQYLVKGKFSYFTVNI